MANVVLRGVSKRFGKQDVIRALDLEINDGELMVVEPLGAQVHVQIKLGDHMLAAMLPPSTMPRPGEQMTLAIDLGELHLFDEGGRRLEG